MPVSIAKLVIVKLTDIRKMVGDRKIPVMWRPLKNSLKSQYLADDSV